MSWLVVLAARRVSARQPTYFSLLRQREVGKRKATPMPAPLACGDRCPVVREERAQAQNSLRSLCSLRSDSCAKFEHEARCARGPALLCSSAWHRGNSKQPTAEYQTVRTDPIAPFPGCWLFGCCPYALPRSAAWLGSARERAFLSSSAQLFERSERSERSEFWAGPGKRASQGTPAAGRGCASGLDLLVPFGSSQKELACRGETRRALTQEKQP